MNGPTPASSNRINTVAFIVLSGLLGVAGQVAMKLGMASLGTVSIHPDHLAGTLLSLVSSPLVVLGLLIYGSGTFFWLVALSRADLSYAYPLASLNYIFALVAAWWLLGEQLTAPRAVGVVAICVGVWAISRVPARTAVPSHPETPARLGTMGGEGQ